MFQFFMDVILHTIIEALVGLAKMVLAVAVGSAHRFRKGLH